MTLALSTGTWVALTGLVLLLGVLFLRWRAKRAFDDGTFMDKKWNPTEKDRKGRR